MSLCYKLFIGLLLAYSGARGEDVDNVSDKMDENGAVEEEGYFTQFLNEIMSSPLNIFLLALITILIYKIVRPGDDDSASYTPPPPPMPPMKKQDLTLQELRKYDGTHESGRILVGVNGKVFDVTRGKRFYGPDGPYGAFAGHDASRAFATFQTDMVKEEYDDLADLDAAQWESVREWEEQLSEKYDYVGKLLKPGEVATVYPEEEEEEEEEDEKKK